jgi:hypothetical protein
MVKPEDEAAYWRWLTGTMTLVEAFALYREEIENFYIKGGEGPFTHS